ncbi:MAG: hypothetical protein IT425_06995 [Pirellulales bacterium]|nr:hypothetical protein [Pirellulales bacterium]
MILATPLQDAARRNHVVTLMARLVDRDGVCLTPRRVQTIDVSLHQKDADGANAGIDREIQPAHAVDPNALLSRSLCQTGGWRVDDVGFNFRHRVEIPADAVREITIGTFLEVRFHILLTTGEHVIVRFQLRKA